MRRRKRLQRVMFLVDINQRGGIQKIKEQSSFKVKLGR